MYTPPEHVHQFTPDYSMLLLSKPKKKRRKGDDLTVWFGGVGSASFKKSPKLKKKKKQKQVSKLELHKSESFQFGNLCPESKYSNGSVAEATTTPGVVEPVLTVQKTGPESGIQEEDVCGVEDILTEDQTAEVVEPVLPVQGTGPDSGKQEEDVPGMEVIHAEDQMAGVRVVEPVLLVHETDLESGKREERVAAVDVIHAEDQMAGVVEPVLPVHETGWESGNQENVVSVEIIHLEDQSTTKPVDNNGSRTQVIIEHSYLGPLCLQFTNLPSVVDVKSEIMERTGLPINDQDIYRHGKKLCDSQSLRPFVDDNQDSLTLTLSVGSLKGGVRPKETTEEGAVGGEKDPSRSQLDAMQSMETWEVEKTASWLCQIGLDKKYAAICQKEDINGRALLLLARDANQLLSVFQLKKGPHTILMKHLKPHLETFEPAKPQTTQKSTRVMNEWTPKELSSWLREIGIPALGSRIDEERSQLR